MSRWLVSSWDWGAGNRVLPPFSSHSECTPQSSCIPGKLPPTEQHSTCAPLLMKDTAELDVVAHLQPQHVGLQVSLRHGYKFESHLGSLARSCLERSM